jgi:hypothetical protein
MLEGQRAYDVSVVTDDSVIFTQQILNIFEPACGFKEYWFVPEDNGGSPPLIVRKPLVIYFGVMMGVDDEAIYTDSHKVVHCVCYDGAISNCEERLRAVLSQRAKPCSQPCPQNKCSLESPFNQTRLASQEFSRKTLLSV